MYQNRQDTLKENQEDVEKGCPDESSGESSSDEEIDPNDNEMEEDDSDKVWENEQKIIN